MFTVVPFYFDPVFIFFENPLNQGYYLNEANKNHILECEWNPFHRQKRLFQGFSGVES